MGASQYIVNGNTYQNATAYSPSVGVLAWGTGGSYDIVNNNTYSGLNIGNLSNYKNTNGATGASANGLQFICNTYTNNFYDEAIRGSNPVTDGICAYQGVEPGR